MNNRSAIHTEKGFTFQYHYFIYLVLLNYENDTYSYSYDNKNEDIDIFINDQLHETIQIKYHNKQDSTNNNETLSDGGLIKVFNNFNENNETTLSGVKKIKYLVGLDTNCQVKTSPLEYKQYFSDEDHKCQLYIYDLLKTRKEFNKDATILKKFCDLLELTTLNKTIINIVDNIKQQIEKNYLGTRLDNSNKTSYKTLYVLSLINDYVYSQIYTENHKNRFYISDLRKFILEQTNKYNEESLLNDIFRSLKKSNSTYIKDKIIKTFIENLNDLCLINQYKLLEFDITDKEYLDMFEVLNSQLKEMAVEEGVKCLDVFSATKGKDGLSNLEWHLDAYHLKPIFYLNSEHWIV